MDSNKNINLIEPKAGRRKKTAFRINKFAFGDHSDLDPPDSMPNSEVKRISADGSVGVSPCESRTSPGF